MAPGAPDTGSSLWSLPKALHTQQGQPTHTGLHQQATGLAGAGRSVSRVGTVVKSQAQGRILQILFPEEFRRLSCRTWRSLLPKDQRDRGAGQVT